MEHYAQVSRLFDNTLKLLFHSKHRPGKSVIYYFIAQARQKSVVNY